MKQEVIDLIGDIAETCVKNDLTFEYLSHVRYVHVYKPVEKIGDYDLIKVSEGWLQEWTNESDGDTLNRILREVNAYVEGK